MHSVKQEVSAQQPKITVNAPSVILVLGQGSRKSNGRKNISAETSCSFTEHKSTVRFMEKVTIIPFRDLQFFDHRQVYL